MAEGQIRLGFCYLDSCGTKRVLRLGLVDAVLKAPTGLRYYGLLVACRAFER